MKRNEEKKKTKQKSKILEINKQNTFISEYAVYQCRFLNF